MSDHHTRGLQRSHAEQEVMSSDGLGQHALRSFTINQTPCGESTHTHTHTHIYYIHLRTYIYTCTHTQRHTYMKGFTQSNLCTMQKISHKLTKEQTQTHGCRGFSLPRLHLSGF